MGINMKTLQLSIVFLTSVYILECKKSHKKTYIIETADDDEYKERGDDYCGACPKPKSWPEPTTTTAWPEPTTTTTWPEPTTTTTWKDPTTTTWTTATEKTKTWETEPPKAWDYGYHGA